MTRDQFARLLLHGTGTGLVSSSDRPLRRLRWGLLAVTVLLGVVAMHSLAGGQHSAHASGTHGPADDIGSTVSTTASVATTTAATDGTPVEDTAAGVAAALAAGHPTVADDAAGCDHGDCGAGGPVCLALLMSLLIAAVVRRIGTWTMSRQHSLNRVRSVMRQGPLLRTPSPLRLGILRT